MFVSLAFSKQFNFRNLSLSHTPTQTHAYTHIQHTHTCMCIHTHGGCLICIHAWFHFDLMNFSWWIAFLAETGQLYGDVIWWTLCSPFDVPIFNILWVDLQRILLCTISHIWSVCLQMSGYNLQVWLDLFGSCLCMLKIYWILSTIGQLIVVWSKVYFLNCSPTGSH